MFFVAIKKPPLRSYTRNIEKVISQGQCQDLLSHSAFPLRWRQKCGLPLKLRRFSRKWLWRSRWASVQPPKNPSCVTGGLWLAGCERAGQAGQCVLRHTRCRQVAPTQPWHLFPLVQWLPAQRAHIRRLRLGPANKEHSPSSSCSSALPPFQCLTPCQLSMPKSRLAVGPRTATVVVLCVRIEDECRHVSIAETRFEKFRVGCYCPRGKGHRV